MNLSNSNPGVLSNVQLKNLIEEQYLLDFPLIPKKDEYKGIDGSSLDLHISNKIWRLSSTAKLKKDECVNELIEIQAEEEFNLDQKEIILQKETVYLIKLKEKIAFNKFKGNYGLYGCASGKSTIGRLDILTRLIVDYSPKYDSIPPDYNGDLYIEVIPLSFNVKLAKGISLNQLRIFLGKPELSRLNNDDLIKYSPMLYYGKGNPVMSEVDTLRVNLKPDNKYNDKPIAFLAKAETKTFKLKDLDLTLDENSHDPHLFWEMEPHSKRDDLKMNINRFYILRSLERLLLPENIAVTCVAYTENLGELRIHYAGFAHPNFGHDRKDENSTIGAPLIFEARCHSFSVRIRHKEQFARIEYYKMSKSTDYPSGYTEQELTLSKFFKKWE
jgi:dCTP deaminase